MTETTNPILSRIMGPTSAWVPPRDEQTDTRWIAFMPVNSLSCGGSSVVPGGMAKQRGFSARSVRLRRSVNSKLRCQRAGGTVAPSLPHGSKDSARSTNRGGSLADGVYCGYAGGATVTVGERVNFGNQEHHKYRTMQRARKTSVDLDALR